MDGAIGELRCSHDVAQCIDAGRIIERGVGGVPQRAEVDSCAVFLPEDRVQPGDIAGGRPWVAQVPDEPTA